MMTSLDLVNLMLYTEKPQDAVSGFNPERHSLYNRGAVSVTIYFIRMCTNMMHKSVLVN